MRAQNDVEKGTRELSVQDAYTSIFENGTGWWTILCTNALCLNSAIQGMESTVGAFISTCAGESFGVGPAEQALFISICCQSAAAGAFFLAPIGDVIGRWKLLFWSTVVMVTFGFLTAAAWDFWSLLIFRSVVGFTAGGMYTSMELLAEYVPVEGRGTMLNFSGVALNAACLFVTLIGWLLLPTLGWRVFVLAATLPFAYNLVQLLYLVESPVWLLQEGRADEALEAVKTMAYRNGCDMPCDSLRAEINEEDPLVTRRRASDVFAEEGYRALLWRYLMEYVDLLSSKYRWKTLKLLIAWFCASFVVSGLGLDDIEVLGAPKGNCAFNYPMLTITTAAMFFGPVTVFLTIDRTDLGILGGRFGTQFWTYMISAAAMLLTGLQPHAGPLTILWASLARGFSLAGYCVLAIQTTELFDTKHRITGIGLANTIGMLGAAVVPFWIHVQASQFVISAGLVVVMLIGLGVVCCLPETAEARLD